MNALKSSMGQEPLDRVVRIGAHYPGIVETGAVNFAVHLADPTEKALETEEAGVRLSFADTREKRAIAASEIELDRSIAGKKVFPR